MAISVDAIEYLTFQDRTLAILKNERVDTGMGVLNEPLMPIPTLLLGLFGTPAKFFLKASDNYDPSTGQVFNANAEVIEAQVYVESLTIETSSGTGQLQGSALVYVPGEAFGYESVALLILTCQDTGDYIRKVELP